MQLYNRGFSFLNTSLLLVSLLAQIFASSQNCANSFLNGELDGSVIGSELQVIKSCSFYGDYSVISNVTAGSILQFTISIGYITVREGSQFGTVLASGANLVNVSGLSGADLFISWNADASCGVGGINCFTTTVRCLNCSPICVAENFSSSVDITNPDPENIIISQCNFSNQYNEITGVPEQRWILINISEGYAILREGTPNGPILDQGTVQLSVITSGEDMYIHYFDDASCSTSNNSTCVSSEILCVTCPWQDPQDGSCFNSNSSQTVNMTSFEGQQLNIGDCQSQFMHAEITGVPPDEDIEFGYEIPTQITVREGQPNGPVVAEGLSPVTVTNASGDDLYVHYTVNENCDTQFLCFQATVQCVSCSACSNPFPAVSESSLITDIGSNSVFVIWQPVVGQLGCQLQLRNAGGSVLGSQVVGGATASNFSIPLSLLQSSTNYEWRVRCGCSQSPPVVGPFSSWQPFSTPAGIVINSNPNPTSGSSNVSFNLELESYTTLEVFDLSGRKIQSIFAGNANAQQEYRFEFDGFGLPNGIYIYRVTTENGIENSRFLIAK